MQALRVGQHRVGGQPHVVEHQLAGDRCPQRQLVVDGVRGETRCARGDQEAPNSAASFVIVGGGPHHGDVGDRSVGDPHLAAVEHPIGAIASRPGFHCGGIGSDIGLGQPEAAEQFARGHAGQPLLFLLLGAEVPDREHRQRSLHRDHRPEAGVGRLQFYAREAVMDGRGPTASVAVQVHAEQAEFAELLAELADRKVADFEPLGDVRADVFGAELPNGVAHRDLVAGQRGIEPEGVVSVEGGFGERRRIRAHSDQPATSRYEAGPVVSLHAAAGVALRATSSVCWCFAPLDAAATPKESQSAASRQRRGRFSPEPSWDGWRPAPGGGPPL